MKFATVLDRDEDGMWIVECPSIPGCVSQGSLREEALENIRAAIVDCLEVRAELGMPLTVWSDSRRQRAHRTLSSPTDPPQAGNSIEVCVACDHRQAMLDGKCSDPDVVIRDLVTCR